MGINRTAVGLIPAAALIAALASCGSGSTESVGQLASIATPAPTATASATDAPSAEATAQGQKSGCAPDDVDVSFGDDPDGGATGELSLVVRFTNNGPGTCILKSRPTVEFLDDGGNSVGLREDENGNGKQYLRGTYKIPFHLQPGSSADVVIAKYRCDLGAKTVATQVKLGLPDVGRATTLVIDRDARQIASCLGGEDDPGQTFAVSGFKTFKCHLVGNATGGGWCEGELGKQPAETPEEAAAAAEKEELARRR